MNRQLTSAIWGLLALFYCLESLGATYYVDDSCANNGDGSTYTCAASGGGVGAFNVATSCTAARGNTCYICGSYSAAYNPGGVGAGDGVSYYVIDGNCPSGQGTMTRLTGAQMGIGGASRANIKVQNMVFESGVTGISFSGAASGGTNFVVTGNVFRLLTTAGVLLQPPADQTISAIDISENTFTNIGDGVFATATGGVVAAPIQQGVGAAPGVVTGLLVHDNVFSATNTATSFYGVNFKPPTNSATGGRIRASKIYENTFTGTFQGHAINVFADTDDTEVYANAFDGTFGGAVIHVGGQTTYGTCGSTTDNTIVRDHRAGSGSKVSGGVINSDFTVDGAGIYSDECSVGTLILRNEATNNAVAGIYLNDADSVQIISNVVYGNGDNAVHIHGTGINLLVYNNTLYHSPTASGQADQGTDGFQIDAAVGTGTVLRNNLVICSSSTPKCLDADASITESNNDVFGGTIVVEGFTPSFSSVDPLVIGPAVPTKSQDLKLSPGSTLRRAGYELNLGNILDHGNRAFSHPPSIGAWEAASGDIATARTAASTRTAATARTAASARTAR